MTEYPSPTRFPIVDGDVGTEAYTDRYVDWLQQRLAAADALLREACEAYRCGYESDCVPNMRLLYLSDRWDEQAKGACGE